MPTEGLALAVTLAVTLDMLLGDPLWLPHPVRWMGKAIDRLEPRFRSCP
jgi:adenosylcobinamide-phosphate synthase